MKNKNYYLLWGSILFFTVIACKVPMEQWDYIKVVNATSEAVYVSAGIGRYGMLSYPDTLLPVDKPSLLIVRGNNFNNLRTSIGWEKAIKYNRSDSLSIYVFDADSIDRYSWEKIKAR